MSLVKRSRYWVGFGIRGKPLNGVFVERHSAPIRGKVLPVRLLVFGFFRRLSGEPVPFAKLNQEETLWASEMIAWLRRSCKEKGIPLVRGDDRDVSAQQLQNQRVPS